MIRSAGAAAFEAPRAWMIDGDWLDARFGDVDGDGVPELLHVDREQSLVVCPNDGRGGPGGPCRKWWSAPDEAEIGPLSVGDGDGDGASEVVALLDEQGGKASVLALRSSGVVRTVALPSMILLPPAARTHAIVHATVRPDARAWVVAGPTVAMVLGGATRGASHVLRLWSRSR